MCVHFALPRLYVLKRTQHYIHKTWLPAFERIYLLCRKIKTKSHATRSKKSKNNHVKEKLSFKICFVCVRPRNLETSCTKSPDSFRVCVSNIQSAAFKWPDLRYNDEQIQRKPLCKEEHCNHTHHTTVFFFQSRPPHCAPFWNRMWGLLSEVIVVAALIH